jgi:hypothetical protein
MTIVSGQEPMILKKRPEFPWASTFPASELTISSSRVAEDFC